MNPSIDIVKKDKCGCLFGYEQRYFIVDIEELWAETLS